jgi:hypothetical protein
MLANVLNIRGPYSHYIRGCTEWSLLARFEVVISSYSFQYSSQRLRDCDFELLLRNVTIANELPIGAAKISQKIGDQFVPCLLM